MNRVLLVVSLALSLVACFPMPPRADEWTFWKNNRVTKEEDVLRAMLECGHRMYADVYEYEEARRNPISHMNYLGREVMTERCMEKEGFRYTSEIGTTCKGGRYSRAYPELPECQLPIEQIPGRDINKRLNSNTADNVRGVMAGVNIPLVTPFVIPTLLHQLYLDPVVIDNIVRNGTKKP